MRAKRNRRSKIKETQASAGKSLSVALARYRILFEQSPDANLITTPEGTIEEANGACAALFGLTPQTIRSRRAADLYVNPADRQAIVEKLNLGQPVRDHAVTLRHAGGSIFEALISTQLIAVPGVTGSRYLSTVRDQTRERMVQRALEASELRFRRAAESLTDVIYEWDLKERVDWYGDIDGMMGYPAGEFPRTLTAWAALLHPDDTQSVFAAIDRQLNGAAPYNLEYRIKRKDHEWRWWSARGTVRRDENDQPSGWIGSITDVTERKLAEQELVIADKELLFQHEEKEKRAAELVIANKELVFQNEEKEKRAAELVIANKELVFHNEERKRAEILMNKYANQLAVINRLDHVISSTFYIEEVYDALVLEMQHLFEFDRTSLIRINDEGTEWQIIKQWTIGEPAFVPGIWRKLEGSVVGWLHKNKRTYVGDRIGEGENWPETDLLRKEGISSRVFVPLIVKGNVIGVMTLASKNSNVYSKPDLQILESLADQVGISMHNARMYGKVREFAATLEKRVEDRTAQLEVANKELEAFAYSVSHDLRAPLRHINGFIELLGKDQGSGVSEKNARYLQIICEAAKQMGELIDDLLTFSRMAREELRKTCLNPTPVVNDVVASLRSEIEGRTVRWMIHELPMVTADPAMLKLVFVNLISNAQKFTRTRDVAEIEVGTIESDGKEIILFVKDNGVGFDMEYVHKLFGVFQRLHSKDEFEGTGIGLANVRRIISRHGGRTWAEGTVGVGASFYFSLPATT